MSAARWIGTRQGGRFVFWFGVASAIVGAAFGTTWVVIPVLLLAIAHGVTNDTSAD